MNCPSRTDEPEGTGFNQNPNFLARALTTRNDLNGIANSRLLRRNATTDVIIEDAVEDEPEPKHLPHREKETETETKAMVMARELTSQTGHVQVPGMTAIDAVEDSGEDQSMGGRVRIHWSMTLFMRLRKVVMKFRKFLGPGFMIAVAYIDPGNYSTDVAAGATYRFKLLFIVFMSNIFAIFLQSLCIKLGSVSGLNLAEACREFLPMWLNIALYIMAEAAIIATDIAEVIGTAIAINLLIPKIPLVAGCALSIFDVLLILLFYRPNESMKGLRAFEMFVIALVLGVSICFCIQLSLIKNTSVGEVFRGYLPSSAIVQSQGLYQACGILGATVMPHSLYLGSGIVQPRLREYDIAAGLSTPPDPTSTSTKSTYQPSLPAINFCLKYSIAELSISLFTFALFINSAILIVAGSALSSNSSAATADLFGIHALLSSSISPVAGTVFALALLLSGISAGIICTIAGQMVSEGALNWSIRPWLRRLITRSISITPSIIIAGAVGKEGLNAALNGTQVALSIILPFVSAPLIYFTCRNKYMTVRAEGDSGGGEGTNGVVYSMRRGEGGEEGVEEGEGEKMRNHWFVTVFAVLTWTVIAAMNVANLVLLGKGQSGA